MYNKRGSTVVVLLTFCTFGCLNGLYSLPTRVTIIVRAIGVIVVHLVTFFIIDNSGAQ